MYSSCFVTEYHYSIIVFPPISVPQNAVEFSQSADRTLARSLSSSTGLISLFTVRCCFCGPALALLHYFNKRFYNTALSNNNILHLTCSKLNTLLFIYSTKSLILKFKVIVKLIVETNWKTCAITVENLLKSYKDLFRFKSSCRPPLHIHASCS